MENDYSERYTFTKGKVVIAFSKKGFFKLQTCQKDRTVSRLCQTILGWCWHRSGSA
jgi:hypothetical protein